MVRRESGVDHSTFDSHEQKTPSPTFPVISDVYSLNKDLGISSDDSDVEEDIPGNFGIIM